MKRLICPLRRVVVEVSMRRSGLRKHNYIVSGALLAALLSVIFFATSTNLEAQAVGSIPLSSVTWTPIGPAPTVNGRTDYIENASGRIAALAAHPTDPSIIYIAAAGGGVWKTTDGGITWTPLTDTQSTLFMGAIALASSNPDVVYAGTGEANMGPSKARNFRDNIYYGRGILKSTDAGGTWTLLGGTEFDRRTISKIVVDPTDPNTVYVAVGPVATNGLPGNAGIWKSIDGGTTWNNTTTSISTMAAFSDLVIDPSDRMTLYAAVGDPGCDPINRVFNCDPANRLSNGVYKTTDGGATWDRAKDFPTGAEDPLIGRIALAISQTAPQSLYASIARPGRPNSLTISRYRLTRTREGEATWTILPAPTRLGEQPDRICPEGVGVNRRFFNYLSSAGDYHMTLAVDPSDANTVYAGGVCLIRSTDGGETATGWVAIAEGETAGPHRDHHALAFDANSPRKLLNGNDGGIWRLDDPDLLTWANLNGNLQITQFVGIALHPTNPDVAYGGTQDTGVMKFQGDVQWKRQLRGDGGAFAVNTFSPNIQPNNNRVYTISKSSATDGNFFKRSNNGGEPFPSGLGSWVTQVSGIDPIIGPMPEERRKTNFYPPVVLEPSNANPNLDRLLLGTFRVYETVNGAVSWNPLTPGLSGWTVDENTPIDSLAAAPSDLDTIYASAGGHILVTFDHGDNWQQRDIPGVTDHFRALLVDPTNNLNANQIAYAVRDRFGGGHVFRTTDGGQSWTDISGDLPDLPTNTMVLDPRVTPHVLYVGTDDGVYVSTDLGAHWVRFGMGLPNVQVTDLKLNPGLNVLAAGTHGRGVWEILILSLGGVGQRLRLGFMSATILYQGTGHPR